MKWFHIPVNFVHSVEKNSNSFLRIQDNAINIIMPSSIICMVMINMLMSCYEYVVPSHIKNILPWKVAKSGLKAISASNFSLALHQ
jgi:hypothetical protein